MAKKNYTVVKNAFNAKVILNDASTSTLSISGTNSKGTLVNIEVTLPDYFFSYIVTDMAKILKDRVRSASERLNDLSNAISA